jgi:hypothetical protein
MLTPQFVRTLLVDPARHPRGQPHLSAASGLVRVQERFYVVADDEHHLGKFKTAPDSSIKLVRLFDGDLPDDAKQRKARKPDLETLAVLPPMPGYPQGALLTLGSGSRPVRERGLLLALDAQGKLDKGPGSRKLLNLSALYAPLRSEFADLNIEGCFVANGVLKLLQRGNQGNQHSACISLDWAAAQAWLLDAGNAPPRPQHITTLALGDVDGVPLSPTDATPLPGGAWVFSAAAENTSDSFHDGPCAGSAVGIVSADGTLKQLHRLQGAPKVEGITAQVTGSQVLLSMVTDADDPRVASQLLTVSLQLG